MSMIPAISIFYPGAWKEAEASSRILFFEACDRREPHLNQGRNGKIERSETSAEEEILMVNFGLKTETQELRGLPPCWE